MAHTTATAITGQGLSPGDCAQKGGAAMPNTCPLSCGKLRPVSCGKLRRGSALDEVGLGYPRG
jgi:hypothetical protein